MIRRLKLAALLLLATLAAGVFWLANSESGLQWAYRQVVAQVPGSLRVERISGRLVGPIRLENLSYDNDRQRVEARRVSLDWNPWALLGMELEIESLATEDIDVIVEPAPTTTTTTTTTTRMPRIDLPISIALQSLQVTHFRIVRGDSVTTLQRLDSSFALRSGQLEVDTLELENPQLQLQLRGSLTTGPELAHELAFDWSGQLPSGETLQGNGRLQGNLDRTRLEHRIDGATRGQLDLELEDPLQQLKWRAELNLEDIDSNRFDASLPPLRGALQIDARGDLQQLAANGTINLEESPYGSLSTEFEVEKIALGENAGGLSFAGLQLNLLRGRIDADGSVDWTPQLQWRTQIETAGIDPSLLLPQWPGRIDSRLALRGSIEDSGPAIALDLERLKGELRGYPIRLQGSADWRDQRVRLGKVELRSGNSRVAVDGSVGQEIDLVWSLQSADLAELYPETKGELSANGRLGGSFEAASVAAELSGSKLGYTEYKADALNAALTLDLDLSRIEKPELRRIDLELDASEVWLLQRRLHSVRLAADNRRLRTVIEADEGNADIELVGELTAGNWRGNLVRARLQNNALGTWNLLQPVALNAAPGQIKLDRFCFVSSHSGRLCGSVEHRDAGGFAELELDALPLGLLQPWLPPEVSLAALTDADIKLNYALPGRLLGQAAIDLQPGHFGYSIAPDQHQRIEFEGARLKLDITETGIDARADLELANDDGLHGALELPGANPLDLDMRNQSLRGRFDLRLRDLSLLDANLAGIDRLYGDARVNFDVAGSLAQPRLQGSLQLDNAGFHIPELDLEVTRLDIEAHQTDLSHLQFQVTAQAAQGKLTLNGNTTLDADAGWPSRINLVAEDLVIAELVRQRLPENLVVDGRVNVNADLSLRQTQQLHGTVAITSPTGSLTYPLPRGETGSWEYRDINLGIELGDDGANARGGFDIGDNRLQVELRLPGIKPFALEAETQPLDGDVEIAFNDLSLLDTLLPDLQNTSGSLQLKLQVGGNLARPQLRGRAEMRDTTLQVARLGISLQQFDFIALAESDDLVTFTAGARSGDGYVELKGSTRLDPESGWPTSIDINGENFEAAQTPEATINLSPRLKLTLVHRNIDISGEVLIPYAKLQPRDVTTAARVSNDVVIVDEEQDAGERWQIKTSIRLIFGERVTFFGYGFDGRLGGNILIEESPGKPTRGTGEITIIEGRYRAYGQHLDVEKGRLLFTGGPLTNPGLDLQAVRQTGTVIAGIKVSGLLQRPRLELFSIPAMGEADTLSYLLTGGPLESASSGQGAMMANAALALGLTGGDRLARSIGDQFGLDEMRVESSSSGDQASLVVGRYLSPRLYVGYGVGLIESINTLNLRYRISDRWQLEAESGENQGADVFYRFER